ncbi:MAG TPA: NAD(P)-dependent oxidoreductase [Thermodesulfobacteriota bacterium]
MMPQTLVTGAFGCIGAWVVRGLVDAGERPVLLDYGTDPWRVRMVAGDERLAKATVLQGDIADGTRIADVVREYRITRIIHLAAWQVPLCRQDPVGGARVNVIGTNNVFEAAKANPGQVERVVYVSSAAVFGPASLYDGPVGDDAARLPATHYGVYKVANEDCAKVYWAESRIPSIGFRPLTVYGPGRDFGLTADPTLAIKAAVLGRPFRIRWGGASDLIYAADVAAALIAAANASLDGARVYNLHGESVAIADIPGLVEAALPEAKGLITYDPTPIPFPAALSDEGYQRDLGPKPRTSFADGLRRTIEEFQALRKAGRLDARELPAA